MKKKILSIILSFTMVFSTTGFAFADTDLDNPPAESVKVEKEVKTEDSSQEKIEKEEPQKEEVKQEENKQEENKQEEPKEEVQVQEVKKATKENKVLEEKTTESIIADEPQVKEEETISYPFTVTYNFYYMDANGNWTENSKISWSQTVKDEGFNAAKSLSYFNKYPVKKVSNNEGTHTFKNDWSNLTEAEKQEGKIRINTKKFTKDTTISCYALYNSVMNPKATVYLKYMTSEGEQVKEVGSNYLHPGIGWDLQENHFDDDIDLTKEFNYQGYHYVYIGLDKNLPYSIPPITKDEDFYFTAEYEKTPLYKVNIKWINNINETQNHSWSNNSDNTAFNGYSNATKAPTDYDEHYSFLYWDCDFDNKHYTDSNPYHLSQEVITDNTEVNLLATYDFQPSVKVVYHYKNGNTYATESYKQPIDIYASASVQNIDWYYNLSDKNPITKGTKAELPDVIPDVTKPQIDEPVVVDVYEKTKEESVAPTNPDPINPDPVVPGKIIADKSNTTKAKAKTNNTNEAVYYGMGDGDFTITKQPSFIKKNPLPLNLSQQDYWALLNLIFAIATCVLAFLLIIFGILNKKDEDENIEVKNKWWIRIITAFIGIASLIIFFLTENMNNPWVWIDNWTLLMAIIFIINIILMIVAKHKEKEKEE